MERGSQRAARITGDYTVDEAATILQFHPDAIRYWLRVGELCGRFDAARSDWVIHADALVAFLRQNGEHLPDALPDGGLPAPYGVPTLAEQGL